MDVQTATMNLVDFKYAVFMGFVERRIKTNTMDDNEYQRDKQVRIQNMIEGTGPV